LRYYKFWNALYEGDAILDVDIGMDPAFSNWLGASRWSTPVPEPLPIKIEDGGLLLPYYRNPFPIMESGLLRKMRDSGVNNIDDYAVVITDHKSGRQWTNYRALNVIGAISAVDESVSEGVELDAEGQFGKFYDTLYVDEAKARGALVFRLAESLSCFVVAESVKQAMLFYPDTRGMRFTPLFVADNADDADENNEGEV
jgi:hypothetical protein